ncbi:hypothetical protein ACHAXT_005333 [Thalassiosira profunda]
MGKQSKRKHKRRSGGSGAGRHHRPTGLADDPAATAAAGATDESSPVANVVGKIRHGDPRVRHAALVALSGTVYDGSSLASAASGTNRKGAEKKVHASDPTLLRALAERLLDPDVPCATAAAGCLSNYASFYCGAGGMEDGSEGEVAAEVMVPILLQRLQGSVSTLTSQGNQMSNPPPSKGGKKEAEANSANSASTIASAIEKMWPSFQEQWALLSLSLATLAGLIENCPRAVRRAGANAFPQLLAVLPLARSSVEFMRKEGGGVLGSGDKEERELEPLLDGATNAARALHSLLDDNEPLISALPVGSLSSATSASSFGSATAPSLLSAVTELTSIIPDYLLPDAARLHASGAVLSLRRVIVLDGEMNGSSTKSTDEEQVLVSAVQHCTNTVVVPMLYSLVTIDETSDDYPDPQALVSQMIDLSQKLSTIKQDAAMESQVVQEVKARKEPAREIARRQKKMKEEREAAKQAQMLQGAEGMELEEEKQESKEEGAAEATAAMVVEDDASKEDVNAQQQQEEEGKLQQELDDVVQSWRGLLGSRKLALELAANLCSGREEGDGDEGGMYEDDDEHMWDSDDEARLAAGHAQQNMMKGEGCTPSERDTYESVAERHLPEQILSFFGKWAAFLPSMQNKEGRPPELVAEDVEELLATCALCLGNVAACYDLPTWDAPARKGSAATVENGLQLFWWELVSILAAGGDSQLHATSVMLSLLRAQPPARTLVDAPTLDLLFGLLSQLPNESKDSDALVQTHCNAISMLGVLCSEPHPASIDARVCSALLERLRSAMVTNNADSDSVDNARYAIITTHEVLNVLMDIYGADECHEDVFQREDVLGHFQRSLPGYKRRIKRISSSAAREELGVWNETALNASRFIKYKQEG